MDITPLVPKGRQVITGYGDGGFKINQERLDGSLIVFPERRLRWNVASAAILTLNDLKDVLAESPAVELLLIGTGEAFALPDPAIADALKARRIALEVMDTGAACRTYNILLSEERRVAAALIAV